DPDEPCGSTIVPPAEGEEIPPSDRGKRYSFEDHWAEPNVIKIRYAREVLDFDGNQLQLTTEPDIRKNRHGRTMVRIPGTANGHMVIQPPDTDVQHHYGHGGRGGNNEAADLPDQVSDSAVTLWSGEDGSANTRGVQLNFGVLAEGTLDPANGIAI